MSGLIEFVQLRGEYASMLVVAVLLALAARPVARLLALPRNELGDHFWNGGVAFVVAGRLAYLALESPQTLIDPLVLIRLQGGIEPLAGVAGVAAVLAWRVRRRGGELWPWATAAAVGVTLAVIGYDLACVLRDACYGATVSTPLGFQMSGLSEPRVATPLIEAAVMLAILSALLAAAPRFGVRALALSLVAALALLRAALTPASALGLEAVGVETLLLVALGVGAVATAILPRTGIMRGRRVA